jgi:transcriptional regulator with XRE-family HTH domain
LAKETRTRTGNTVPVSAQQLRTAQQRSRRSAVSGDASPLVEYVRGLLFNGRTWENIAEKAGVSPATVQAFASRKTRHPRLETFVGISDAVGVEVVCKVQTKSGTQMVSLNKLSRKPQK